MKQKGKERDKEVGGNFGPTHVNSANAKSTQ